jgi:hypothetical protein
MRRVAIAPFQSRSAHDPPIEPVPGFLAVLPTPIEVLEHALWQILLRGRQHRKSLLVKQHLRIAINRAVRDGLGNSACGATCKAKAMKSIDACLLFAARDHSGRAGRGPAPHWSNCCRI